MSEPDPLLLSFLGERDALCPVCEYNLRGLKADRCPECSSHLQLQVGSENIRLGPWVSAVVSFALAVGFDAVMGLMVSIAFAATFFSPQQVAPLVRQQHLILMGGFLGMGMTCATAILLLVRRRRRWMVMPRRAQWRWAGVTFASVFVVHLVVGLLMARML
ncbi:MAG: hypothetical protein KF678_08810 [Phycisphaeraceae bacterium]|nr:hypothetical protein [Phycisphaeraceae bacterium]